MSIELAVSVSLSTMNCGECGGTYAINERYRQQKYDKGEGWTCPYCKCNWGYYEDSEVKRLEKQLATAKNETYRIRKQKEWAEQEAKNQKNTARAFKASATRAKNKLSRTKAGVCPCCNRTFKQLAAHMKNKHPAWEPKK